MALYDEITFAQRMIADLANTSLSTVSRLIEQKKLEGEKQESGRVKKKYPLEVTRSLIRELRKIDELNVIDKVQVFYNFKGGTGKTTLCAQVAFHLSIMGFRVLLIDSDAQGNLSLYMNQLNQDLAGHTLLDIMLGTVSPSKCIKTVFPGLDIIPGNLHLTKAEISLSTQNNREKILSRCLDKLKESYDYILIDTNPTISNLNYNSIYAADNLNIVCSTQPIPYAGVKLVLEDIARFSKEMDNVHKKIKIIPNHFEQKTSNAQEVLGLLRQNYPKLVANSVIRKSEEFNECSKLGIPLCFKYRKEKSAALEDTLDFVNEMISATTELINKSKVA